MIEFNIKTEDLIKITFSIAIVLILLSFYSINNWAYSMSEDGIIKGPYNGIRLLIYCLCSLMIVSGASFIIIRLMEIDCILFNRYRGLDDKSIEEQSILDYYQKSSILILDREGSKRLCELNLQAEDAQRCAKPLEPAIYKIKIT